MPEGLSTEGFVVVRRLLPMVAAGALADRARELTAAGGALEGLHEGDPVFAPTSRYPTLVDAVEEVLGPDVDIVAARFGAPGPDGPGDGGLRVWIATGETALALTGPAVDNEVVVALEAGDVVVAGTATAAHPTGDGPPDPPVAEYDYGPAGAGLPIRRGGEPAYDRPTQEAS